MKKIASCGNIQERKERTLLVEIKDFSGYYISENGSVYTNSCSHFGDLHLLKPQKQRTGYLTICLHKNKKQYTKTIHRLVAEAFVPNPKNKPEVNHIDGDKTNNCVENLEWTTRSENQKHRYNILNKRNKSGKDCVCSKIVLQIKDGEIIAEFFGTQEAYRITGIKQQSVSACCCGKQKTAGGFQWKYKRN